MARADDKATTSKLAALLTSDAPERQVAAAIVIGELDLRDPVLLDGLLALTRSGIAPLQRHAVEALERVGTVKTLPHLMPLLAARDEGVRRAAAAAVSGFGAAALPLLRARLTDADGEERRAVEAALARLGGKAAVSTLLAGLDPTDIDAARAATLPMRQPIKDADARQRRGTLAEVKHFLTLAKTKASPAATVAALRLLGFLEDDSAVPLLLEHATGPRRTPEVREEALIALRFVGRGAGRGTVTRTAGAVAEKLVALAETAPLATARVALYTLACLPVPASLARRLAKLAAHAEAERARLATERLAQMPSPEASHALGRLLLDTRERTLAEAAATALSSRPDAGPTLARALLDAPDADRAGLLAKLLRPHLRTLDARTTRALRDTAVARLTEGAAPARRAGAGPRPWEALLHSAREADPGATAQALRAAAQKLRKAGATPAKLERALAVLRALGRSAEATPDDGYAWATLELAHGRRDEALAIFGQLTDRGYDLAAALRRDRGLDAETRYQIGFHFAERRHPVGEEILGAVAQAGGRTKVAQMARAKLRSAGYAS